MLVQHWSKRNLQTFYKCNKNKAQWYSFKYIIIFLAGFVKQPHTWWHTSGFSKIFANDMLFGIEIEERNKKHCRYLNLWILWYKFPLYQWGSLVPVCAGFNRAEGMKFYGTLNCKFTFKHPNPLVNLEEEWVAQMGRGANFFSLSLKL